MINYSPILHNQAPMSSVISGCFLKRHFFSRCCFILFELCKGSFFMLLEPNLATQLMSQDWFWSPTYISTNKHLIYFDFISTMLSQSPISLQTNITQKLQKDNLAIGKLFFLKFLRLINLFPPEITEIITDEQLFQHGHLHPV